MPNTTDELRGKFLTPEQLKELLTAYKPQSYHQSYADIDWMIEPVLALLAAEKNRVWQLALDVIRNGRPVGGGGEFYDGPGAIYNDGWEAAHDKIIAALIQAAKEDGNEL